MLEVYTQLMVRNIGNRPLASIRRLVDEFKFHHGATVTLRRAKFLTGVPGVKV